MLARRSGYVLLLLLVLVPVGQVLPDRPATPTTLKDYARTLQGRQAFAVYVKDVKVGWMTIDTRLGKHDGKDVLTVSEESHFKLNRGGSNVPMIMKSRTLYSLEGAGDVLLVEECKKEADSETIRKAVRQGDQFVISTVSPKTERKVTPPRKNLATVRKLDDWLRSNPDKGARHESYALSLEDSEVDTKEVYTYQGKKSVALGGVTTELYHVHHRARGAFSDLDVRADGTPFRGTIGGILEMRSEPEEQAKKLDAKSIDLLEIAAIPVDKDLGEAEKVELLTLEVHGLGDYELPTSPRQMLKPAKEKGAFLLELKRDFKPEKEAPLSEAERKTALRATPSIQSNE